MLTEKQFRIFLDIVQREANRLLLESQDDTNGKGVKLSAAAATIALSQVMKAGRAALEASNAE